MENNAIGSGPGNGEFASSGRAGQGLPGGGKPGAMLERLLSYTVKEKDLADVSTGLMKRFKGLRGVLDASHEELKDSGWVGENSAVFLKFVKEAAGVYLRERMLGRDALKNMKCVLDYLSLTLSGERIEKFLAIYLNSKNEVLSVDVLHEGTINQTVVYPRKAIERAFRHKACGVIFVHNHPSGDSTPSAMDRQLARTLDSAAGAVDLSVIDHIVIGKNRHFSARENGWMAGGPSRKA
ncbi:MAG: DNA repair protein RadC [Deltaproteobacteria bacterium]|nr:DNA repair protein RadC [Deltaproteobacteria bacterium]